MSFELKEILPAQRLKLYIFTSAAAVNIFLQVIMVPSILRIQYFFYSAPMTIQIDFFSTIGNILVWTTSLYVVYALKKAVESTPTFQLTQKLLKLAIIGSFLLLTSLFLAIISVFAENSATHFLYQLGFLVSSAGYVVSFAGSSLAFFVILFRNRSMLKLFLLYFSSLLIPVEIWSLAHWVAYPFNVVSHLGFAWRGAFIELQLFYATYPLILWLFIAFLFSWAWMPLMKNAIDRIKRGSRFQIKPFSSSSESNTDFQSQAKGEKLSKKDGGTLEISAGRLVPITLLIVLCVFVAYYPYINLKPGLVGWDTPGYSLLLTEMADRSFSDAVQFAATTSRPLYFLLLYSSTVLTQLPPVTVIELAPVATVLVNTLAVFWFVNVGEKRVFAASFAAVFSILSFNTTIAMHAGILANWFAVALGFTLFGLVIRLQEKMSKKTLFLAVLAAASVFFIHYWSGIFLSLVLGCYMFLTLLERRGHSVKSAVVVVLSALIVLVVLLSSGLALNFFPSYGITENMGSTGVFAMFWAKLPILIDSWFFGALANPMMMSLALIGIAVCCHRRTKFDLMLISWTVVGSLLTLFVSPIGRNMNQWLMWRTLYLIPFQIPAAIGLVFLVTQIVSHTRSNRNQVPEVQHNRFRLFPTFLRRESLVVMVYLILDYGILAFTLALDSPFFGVLVLLNCLPLTLLVYFKLQRRDTDSILVFVLVTLAVLLMFNYALRSLAPLAIYRTGS